MILDAELPLAADAPRRLVIELTNICNLHCSYCLRDDEALYQTRARFFPIELLRRILRDARESAGVSFVSFTGGEPTLHPQFSEILKTVGEEGMRAGFVTNAISIVSGRHSMPIARRSASSHSASMVRIGRATTTGGERARSTG